MRLKFGNISTVVIHEKTINVFGSSDIDILEPVIMQMVRTTLDDAPKIVTRDESSMYWGIQSGVDIVLDYTFQYKFTKRMRLIFVLRCIEYFGYSVDVKFEEGYKSIRCPTCNSSIERDELYFCGSCREQIYCGESCQERHWNECLF